MPNKAKSKIRKIVFSIFSIIFLFVFSFNAFLYVKLPDMVFYPLKEVNVTPKDWDLSFESVRLKSADNKTISGWYIPAAGADKTVLFFHGNGGNISHRGNSLYIFHKLKLNVLIIDYLGYGESEGMASEKGLYQSANAAWDYLIEDKAIKPETIIIFGRSLGGVVAVDLASRVNAGGLIIESTFSALGDIVDIYFPVLSHFFYLRYDFDSVSKIKKVTVPVLAIHSPDDEVIPFELGQKLFEGVTSEKTFLQIKGGHNDGFMQSIASYMKTLRTFIQAI